MVRSITLSSRESCDFGAADEGAAADVARRQAAARRLGVGARDGGDGHAEVIGQVAVRRESRPRPQRAILHILVDGVGNGAVLGPRRPSSRGSHIVIGAIY